MKKSIDHILLGREKHITEDETVLQPLPHQEFRFANPFIVLHHMRPKEVKAGEKMRIHPHPHRGFAPVTFMLQGEGYHMDNAGHSETVGAGDAQWMFAGKGLLHSEGPSENMLRTGGTHELLQLWVNVPAANKWDAPSYQSARKAALPKAIESEGVELRLVSGSYAGHTGPLKAHTPIVSMVGEVAAGKRIGLKATPGYWTLLYIAKGTAIVNEAHEITEHHLLIFEKDNSDISLEASEDVQLLYLSAEPINEPVAAKDNFVMNTPEEIEQALTDYKNGVFGTLSY